MSKFKAIIGASLILSFASHVAAQDAGLHLIQDSDRLGMQAALRLSIPFGTAEADRFEDRATVKFAVSATRIRSGFGQDVREISSQDIFAIGIDESLQPRLSLSGQDISYAAFPSVYRAGEEADTDTDEEVISDRNIQVVAGAFLLAMTVTTVIVLVETGPEIVDAVEFID